MSKNDFYKLYALVLGGFILTWARDMNGWAQGLLGGIGMVWFVVVPLFLTATEKGQDDE